jgi:hypothetical protein
VKIGHFLNLKGELQMEKIGRENVLRIAESFQKALNREKAKGTSPQVSFHHNKAMGIVEITISAKGMASQSLEMNLEEFKWFESWCKSNGGIEIVRK